MLQAAEEPQQPSEEPCRARGSTWQYFQRTAAPHGSAGLLKHINSPYRPISHTQHSWEAVTRQDTHHDVTEEEVQRTVCSAERLVFINTT